MMLDEPIEWNEDTDKEKVMDYVFAHQRITKANDAILEQYGATREQYIGLTPNDLFKHNLKEGKKFGENSSIPENFVLKLIRKNGWIWYAY